jgi:sortase A
LKRKISYVLIVAGIALILFPWAREYYYDWQQEKLLSQMEQLMLEETNVVSEQLNNEYKQLQQVFDQETETFQEGQEAGQVQSQGTTPVKVDPISQKVAERAIAVIKIDKIDLRMPILDGATDQNLKYAAARMTETSQIGEIGNAAIAGHRARTYGRQFNRLDELKKGDEIVIQKKGAALTYEVYNTIIVEPTDLSVLKSNKKDSIITLITCEPIVEATHRLIVQAKLKSSVPTG